MHVGSAAPSRRPAPAGTLARCSSILADYGAVGRRSTHPEEAAQGGSQDRRYWYHTNLAIYTANYSKGAYADFDGEPDVLTDAVDLTTIHKAKGLEWDTVFVPSLTSRFPSSRTGRPPRLAGPGAPVQPAKQHRASGSMKFTWRVGSEGAIRSGMSSGRCIADRSGKIERSDGARSRRLTGNGNCHPLTY